MYTERLFLSQRHQKLFLLNYFTMNILILEVDISLCHFKGNISLMSLKQV